MSEESRLRQLRFRGKADPYLEWAYATEFRSFFKPDRAGVPPRIGLLLEWLSVDHARAAASIAAAMNVFVARVYLGHENAEFPAPIRSIWGLSGTRDRLIAFIDRAFEHLARVELAAPIAVRGSPLERVGFSRSNASRVVGVLDDGCAFANTRFRMSNGGTRLLWLWDQDPGSNGLPVTGLVGPSPNVDFSYGGHWSRAELNTVLAGSTPEAAYDATNLFSLRRAATHGTHVMDLAGGATDWDLVFVQWPRAAIEDSSGRWLSINALDGLFYVIACAGSATDKIVVNLSWGPQTDGHDGLGIFEIACKTAILEQAALGRELIVTIASGNSYGSQAHAAFEVQSGGDFEWVIPPDGKAPTFLEVWWPPAMPEGAIVLNLRAPTGEVFTVAGANGQQTLGTYGHVVLVDQNPRGVVAMVTVEATESLLNPRGLAGRWHLSVAAVGTAPAVSSSLIHVYVARADHNMGAHRRGKATYLTDAALDQARFVEPARRFDEVPGSRVRRRGTLNGVGTGTLAWTVGGYRHSDLAPAPYTSSGGSRGARAMPDASCITDRSPVRQGIRAAAVRSGTKVLLIGTSTAAPQLARKVATGDWATENPPSNYDPLRQGFVMLKADPGLLG